MTVKATNRTTTTPPTSQRNATIGPVAQLALALEHEPAGAEQRISEREPDPGQDRERVQPGERVVSVLAIHDRYAAHHRADRSALDERDHGRAEEESPVPDDAHALAAEANSKAMPRKIRPNSMSSTGK